MAKYKVRDKETNLVVYEHDHLPTAIAWAYDNNVNDDRYQIDTVESDHIHEEPKLKQ